MFVVFLCKMTVWYLASHQSQSGKSDDEESVRIFMGDFFSLRVGNVML